MLTVFHFLPEFFRSHYISLDFMFNNSHSGVSDLILYKILYLKNLQSIRIHETEWSLNKLERYSINIELIQVTSWNHPSMYEIQCQKEFHVLACTPCSHSRSKGIRDWLLPQLSSQLLLHKSFLYSGRWIRCWPLRNQLQVP